MHSTIEETLVSQKTRELCQAILDQENLRTARENIDTFMNDDKSREQYESLMTKGQALQQKQQNSQPLSGEEIADFESHREALLNNPVARAFIDAQEEMHQVQKSIQKYVNKTLELGHLPTEEDLQGGCCGGGGHSHDHGHGHGGCGCSH